MAVALTCLTMAYETPAIVWRTALAALAGSCVIRSGHWLKPMLQLPPLVRIGVVSYGIYLIHGLVYRALIVAAGANAALL